MKKLEIELVPQSSWGNNLRSEANLSKDQWDTLRKESYKKASYRCEVCAGVGEKWPVECHEIWHYDDQTKTQTLKGLISLCPTCHKAKHLGRTLSVEPFEVQEKVLRHLLETNNLTLQQTLNYVEQVFEQWAERSQHQWTLDLTWLQSRL
jgi:hypothetical protein